MENWGLVTYRESNLAYDPQSSSISNKERVVTVIAHELAHQVGSSGRTKKEQSLGVSSPHLACAQWTASVWSDAISDGRACEAQRLGCVPCSGSATW